MNLPPLDDPSRHEAFVKAAQYIMRLTEQQDVYENLAGLMTTFFKTAWAAFASREPSGEIVLHHGTPADRCSGEKILTAEVRGTIAEVLESGFLALQILPLPLPSMTAFMPIQEEHQTRHVMLIGHESDHPLSNDLLNTYLAVAGLAGAKIEQVRDGQELRRHRDHLEELVRTRTADLEEANKELESFSYSVSHDLRSPLRAIDGYARIILRRNADRFDEETRRQFTLIRESAKAMDQLIEDLLRFSRVTRREPAKTRLDMRQLAEVTWEELRELSPDRRMTLKIGPLPPAWGDRSLIKQVFVNLLSNAVKFTRIRNEAEIEAGSYATGDEVIYYVRDNGVGFDMKYQDKLFVVFQRLHADAEYEGTGIGLALVQRIVKRHGGRVWAEGEPGRGAVIHFTLPARQEIGR